MIFSSLQRISAAVLVQSRAMHMAMPMPPPMHSVARPFLASRFCISCSSVTSTRAPDAPIGWPIAIAPPLTLTLEVSQPRSLLTAQACAAKASLASIRSRSPMFQPAFFSAAREAGIGPGAHDLRIDAGLAPGHDAAEHLLAFLGRLLGGHQHHRGGAVIDAGGAAGGHGAVLLEGRLAAWPSHRGSRRGADIRRRRRRCRPCGS